MSTIPIQNLVIDDSTDIGLSSDLINGTYKTSSLTDLSQNVYTKIFDLSSNLNTAISTKENILSFNGPMSKSSNTVSIDLSQYPLKTYVDGSLNTINTTLGTKQNNFTCITPLIKNDVSNNISIDLSAYTTTGNDPNYLLKAGGTMTGNLIVNPAIPNIQLGGTNGHNLGVATAAGHFSASAIAGDMILRSRNKLILQSGATAAFIIDASNNVVIGTTTNALYKLSVDGAFNSTSLYNNGTLINFNAYATNTNLTTNYYNKTSTDSLLNTKQDTLLFTSPLLKDISNNVTIDLSAYPLKTYVDSSLNSLNTNKQNVFTCISPLIKNDVSNNISVDLSAYPLKTEVNNNFYNKTEIDNIKIYLAERQYPPKAYNTSTLQESITYLNQNVFKETITLNTDGIIYGSGTYDIYSSTSYLSSLYLRKDLFNQNLNEVGGHYLQPNYTAPNGTYDKTSNYILNGYFGDWIIVKLPYQIILSRFRFYARPTFNSRSPGLWRCYGSNDGTTFTEITEASNTTTSIPSSTYNTYYEKTLTTFNTPYLYIGWTINKLVGSNSNADTLNFAELQIFGKELVTSTSFNNVISTKQDNLNFTSPLSKDISNNVTIDLSAYPLKTNVDSSLNSLNTNKQNVFTCISPLIKNDISNNISVDLSAYPLKTNVDSSLNSLNTNKQNVFTCISPLIKNDISNNISVDLSAYPLKTNVDSSLNTIDTTLGTKENILTFSAPLTRTTNTIGINLSSYSTTGNDTNYLLKTGGTMTGDLNITTATKVLNFGSRTEDYLIRLFGTDYGFGINGGVLRYNSAANHVFYCAGTERMRLTTDGNLSTTGYIYAGGTTNGLRINGNDYGNTIYQNATTIGGNSANIGFTLRDTNSFNFQSYSSAGAYTTIVSMNTNGVSLFGNLIYNYLFNNTGVSHEDSITDFNNVSKFGYQFVRGNTNGPGTVSTFNQYYQWFIGLGANYGVNSHGCQFALPRYTGQPELSVRFKENNVWTDWFGINSVGVRMPINTWGIGSKDGKSRMGNLNNGATLFRGYGTPTLADNAFEFRNTADSLILNISDSGNASLAGRFSAKFLTISNTNRDLLGINFENTQVGNENNATIYCIQGTFTGFHRCFTEDELFNKDEPQVFKDNYEGRIVISTGKIATDTNETNTEWEIKYDKDGITIEDALPQIELSRKKKDKRVFGVLGDKRRNNSRPERLIINSVGEGALWVINSNGNIENGDYITSSDYMGYGEKQDDDLLHNYTVAKSTMDCNFELDSNLYNCLELENGMRIAFIAVTYHCG